MNFFDAGSPYLTHPLLTPGRTAAEIDRVEELVGDVQPGSKILDIGCGFGRHANELAARGHHVVGIDPSPTMVVVATGRSTDHAGGSATFHVGPARDIDSIVDAGSIDLALCLFTTFGQRTDGQAPGASTTTLLASASSALRSGGKLVLEVPARSRAKAMMVENEQLGPTAVTRCYDTEHNILHERFETPEATFDLAVELFEAETVCEMLEAAGFSIGTILEQALVPPPPTFMTVVATRR